MVMQLECAALLIAVACVSCVNATHETRIISGCGISHDDGLTFTVEDCRYEIDGRPHHTQKRGITLAPPDHSYARLDLIYVDAEGVGKQEGMAAETVAIPSVPLPHISLTAIAVAPENYSLCRDNEKCGPVMQFRVKQARKLP